MPALALACSGAPAPPPPTESRPAPLAPQPSPSASVVLAAPPMEAAAILEHVRVLTSEKMAGRAAGSEGERLAAEYIATVLEAARIPPPASGRFQSFPLAPSRKGGGA